MPTVFVFISHQYLKSICPRSIARFSKMELKHYILALIATASIVSAGKEDVSGNFILSRTRRSPLPLFPISSAHLRSSSEEHYRPYSIHSDYGYHHHHRPHSYNFRSSRFDYSPYNIHYDRPSFYNTHGYYPGSSYYNDGDDSYMNWMNMISPQSLSHRKSPGVLVWVPLNTLEHHIELEHQLELQRQQEEEQMHLINLHHHSLLEREQPATLNHHNVPLLDNNDAVFIPDNGIETTFFPLPHDESFSGFQDSNVVPFSSEIGLHLLPLIHSALMHQPSILSAVGERGPDGPSLMLIPPKKPKTITLPIKHPKPTIVPITSTSPTVQALFPSVSAPTAASPPSILINAEEHSTILSNEISKRSPTILLEKKNDVENPQAKL